MGAAAIKARPDAPRCSLTPHALLRDHPCLGGSPRDWSMDTKMLEVVVLGLTSAVLCGVAIAVDHAVATSVFAGLTGAIGVLAVVLRKSQ